MFYLLHYLIFCQSECCQQHPVCLPKDYFEGANSSCIDVMLLLSVCWDVLLTLSFGFPSEACGDPFALGWTRTNSSLVTVATDSVELLTLCKEEPSSMADSSSGSAGGSGVESLPFPPQFRQFCTHTHKKKPVLQL